MVSLSEIKVSVIIPCYNVESFVGVCLESLIHQTLQEIEIICIDDGSTDSTPKILSNYQKKDSRIIVLHQSNKKQGAARNNGIYHSCGEYIAFVDSDDYVELNYLENLYSAAVAADSDIAICSLLKHKYFFTKYNVYIKKNLSATDIHDKIKLCEDTSHRFFYVIGKVYRRKLLTDNNIIFPEKMYFEDVLFSAKVIYSAKKIIGVTGTLYHYIKRKGSTVNSTLSGQKALDHIRAYVELARYAKVNNFILPEKTNYVESFWISPIIKVYQGCYKRKKMFLGIIPIKTTSYKNINPKYITYLQTEVFNNNQKNEIIDLPV